MGMPLARRILGKISSSKRSRTQREIMIAALRTRPKAIISQSEKLILPSLIGAVKKDTTAASTASLTEKKPRDTSTQSMNATNFRTLEVRHEIALPCRLTTESD